MSLNEFLPPLVSNVESVAGQILDYALLLAAIGTITMALLELAKAVLFIRKFFHRWYIGRWLGAAENPDETRDELLLLAAGGLDNAAVLYNQPTGKLMGQVQAAANVALDFPDRYKWFYEFLTAAPRTSGTEDQNDWRQFSKKRMNARPRRINPQNDEEARRALQARARLGNLVSRKLDALQNRIEYDWARLNQLVSVIGGGALLAALLMQIQAKAESDSKQVVGIVLISVLGGMVAPFAKDVVTALSGLRARRT
jgi:hypothetical protein